MTTSDTSGAGPAGRVWFITGASTGFGREIAQAALRRGDFVVATARRPETLDDLVASADGRVLALPLDVTDQAQIQAALDAATARFGRVDVLVNNAGYGSVGVVEVVGAQGGAQVRFAGGEGVGVVRAVEAFAGGDRAGGQRFGLLGMALFGQVGGGVLGEPGGVRGVGGRVGGFQDGLGVGEELPPGRPGVRGGGDIRGQGGVQHPAETINELGGLLGSGVGAYGGADEGVGRQRVAVAVREAGAFEGGGGGGECHRAGRGRAQPGVGNRRQTVRGRRAYGRRPGRVVRWRGRR
ncbi:SDR family NAD(P)-dependent oxidoreductase [Frankia canadensis]|uniref:SDR family NAD(P)-dependent oxidoreductase n=1 Tax=Frankia canadensis TaxID=1836972 RepID=UPI001FB03337|nr:SDR family NAD(P)-dependent oxidoreductase [Frankia canadensis]